MDDGSESGEFSRRISQTRRAFLGSAAAVGASGLAGVVGGGAAATTITGCTTITSSGTYRLAGSISPSSVSDDACIRIEADDVTLEGNGHTVDGQNVSNPDDETAGVSVDDLASDVRIENLAVQNWPVGVYFNAIAGRIEDVTVTDSDTGIRLWNAGYDIVDTTIERSRTGVGLSADGSVTETQGDFEHVTIANNGLGIGFATFAVDNTVTDSSIRNNGRGVATAIRSYGTTITRSNIVGNADYGVANTDITEEEAEGYLPEPVQGADVFEATGNYWGSACGPSSRDDPDAPFSDPVTGLLADGDGDAVSEGIDSGVSNIHFDPFETEAIPGAGRR